MAADSASGMQLDVVASHQSPLSAILLFVVFVGCSDGLAQVAIFGDVALLPPKYTQVCCICLHVILLFFKGLGFCLSAWQDLKIYVF